MQFTEILYLAFSGALVVAGSTMVVLALRAYVQTSRRAMVHLSVGFTLVVGAAAATTVSAFLTGFEGVRSLLLVNSGITTTGYGFVVYSLVGTE